MSKIKIVIADDHQIVRRGLKLLLSDEAEIELVGEASNGKEAIKLIGELKPEILITDITMPEMTGVELAGKVRDLFPEVKVIVLSMHLDEEYVVKSMDAGAKGYLPKESVDDTIIHAIYAVASGETFLPHSVSALLANRFLRKEEEKDKKGALTTREKEVLNLIVEGESNKMIAETLFISDRTVNVHRYNLMKKLKTPNTAALVKHAIMNKLVG